MPILKAGVTVLGSPKRDSTGLDGGYKTGAAAPGSYIVEVGSAGYETQIVSGVTLKTGEVTLRDFALLPMPTSTGDAPDASGFQVSPSLFDDFLTVRTAGSGLLRISDAQGKVLQTAQTTGGSTTFSGLGGWPSGTYVVVFEGKNGGKAVRWVVKR